MSQPATPEPPALASALDVLADDAAHAHHAPALACGVVGPSGLQQVGAVGDLGDGLGRPDEQTLFRIASMSKSFTAAAVLQLRDDGGLRLDDPVATFVPAAAGLGRPTQDAPDLTVRHLLTMGSGLATDDAWADRHLDVDPAALRGWAAEGGAFAVATDGPMEYSNLGYGLLGEVVVAVTGRSLQQHVTERLLAPLGMRHTVWAPSQAPAGTRVALPHRVVDGVAVPDQPDPLGDGALGPMGGLWSTVADLALWVCFWLDAFPARDDADDWPLRRASRREAQRLHRAGPPTFVAEPDGTASVRVSGYGMGLRPVHDPALGQTVTHSGGLPGYGSNMRWVPASGVGAVALANVTYAPMALTTRAILVAFAPSRPVAARPTPEPVASAATALVALLGAWDDKAADRLFADNVALDEPYERRRAEAAALVERLGALRVTSIDADTATSAFVVVEGERGTARLELQLWPRHPAKVQWYECAAVPSGDLTARSAGQALREIAGDLDPAPLAGLLAPDADLPLVRRRLLTAGATLGPFGRDEVVGGDEAAPVVRWYGARGDVDAVVHLVDGLVADLTLTPVEPR